LSFSKPNAGPAAIFVDEFNTCALEGLLHNNECCMSGFGYTGFYLSNGHDADSRLASEILLAPIEETTRCPALCWRNHRSNIYPKCDSINYVEKRLTRLKCRL
jgi:hypothetical protein